MITIAYNAVWAKVANASKAELLEVNRLLSYTSDPTTSGGWGTKQSFFNFSSQTFPSGFVGMVARGLKAFGSEVRVASNPIPPPLGPERPPMEDFGYTERYDYQPAAVDALVKHHQITVQIATGGGKCLGRDTPVLMFDGTIKMVQDVQVGDMLMGPDSAPRTVLSTCVGSSPLYRVTPTKGDAYVVNDAHILSLKKTSRGYRGKNRNGEKYPKGEIVNINIEDYIRQNKTFKHTHKGWRTGVEFAQAAPLSVDPYLLGVILGDGSITGHVSVTTADGEVRSMLEEQAAVWGLSCNAVSKARTPASTIYLTSGRTGGKANPLMVALRDLGFVSLDKKAVKKFIPHEYKVASRSDRLKLLAGIIDTDGYFDGKCMYLTLKEERLFDDVLFLVRSLGFAAYKSARQKTCCNNGVVGTYFSMTISGNLDQIPVRLERRKATARIQKKNHLVTGICVDAIGHGEYYGFEIDGDHLFMLGDFTVTHNTRIARMAMKRINRPTLFLTTRGVLMHQMHRSIETMTGRKCAILGDGEWGIEKEDGTRAVSKFTVGMVQTLAQRLTKKTVESEATAEISRIHTANKAKIDKYAAELRKQKLSPAEIGEKLVKFKKKIERDTPSNKEIALKVRSKVEKHEALREQTERILGKFEFVIVEEAHEVSSESFYTVMAACRNARYRMALTATPFMKDSEESNMRLLASCGPVAIRITEKTLIDRGILAKPYFRFINLPKTSALALTRTTPWQKAYQIGIVENEARNFLIVKEVKRASEYGLNSMILVQRKDHGTVLKELLTYAGLRAEFIFGEDDQKARDKALTGLKNGEIDVLIGSTILDVGVDVPSVGMVVLAGGGKAEVATRQRIGRGLREKKDGGPNCAFIVDFNDDSNNHLQKHTKERRKIVDSTPGFAENIVADFDYEALGFKRKHGQVMPD